MPERLRVGVLASGRGSNFQALVEAAESGRLPVVIAVLISDRDAAPVTFGDIRKTFIPAGERPLNRRPVRDYRVRD